MMLTHLLQGSTYSQPENRRELSQWIDSTRIQKLSEGFWPRCSILVSKVALTPSQLDFTPGGAAGLGYVFKGF
jgi:hypothetical protein